MNLPVRQITIYLEGDVEPERYADTANAIWMQLRAMGHDFQVEVDADAGGYVDKIWDSYSEVSWKTGIRHGHLDS